MIKQAIETLQQGTNLHPQIAQAVMETMLTGAASEEDIAEYLTALAKKGETVDEIVASAEVMRRHCYKLPQQPHTMEIVGTGGDKSNTFNISTTSAILLAAAGVPIAKHGNRAASSQCGSADVLEALGVNIDIAPEKSLELLEENNICFLFAQKFHPAMKYVAPVRKKLGIRTIFNLLGPLTNPLGAKKMMLGVYSSEWVEPMVHTLIGLKIVSGKVVHGSDGIDECSLSAPTSIREIYKNQRGETEIWRSFQEPELYGLTSCKKSDLVGGSPEVNADITRRIFSGEKFPCREAVIWNAAHALQTYKNPENSTTVGSCIEEITKVLDSGKAMKTLENFIRLSNS